MAEAARDEVFVSASRLADIGNMNMMFEISETDTCEWNIETIFKRKPSLKWTTARCRL